MLATALAANALSVSVPLAGPELGTAFTFRRFTGQGADATLAVWSLVVGGVVSTAAGALLVVGGGLSSGNVPVTVAAVATGLLAAAAIAAAVVATRRPRVRGALEKSAAWVLQHGARLSRRPAEQLGQVIRSWAGSGRFACPGRLDNGDRAGSSSSGCDATVGRQRHRGASAGIPRDRPPLPAPALSSRPPRPAHLARCVVMTSYSSMGS